MPNKPRVALVAWDVGTPGSHVGLPADVILAGRDRFGFTVVSNTLAAELRPLVEWRRVRAPAGSFRARWAAFYAGASAQVARTRADVIHTRAPAPLIANRVDLASVVFCHAAFRDAGGGGPLSALTCGLERLAYGGTRTRLVEVETPAAADAFTRHYPRATVEVVPIRYDLARFCPDPGARAALRAEAGIPEEAPVALFTGRDPHAKGLRYAIEGLARAPSVLRLWVAGCRDDALARDAGVAERVTWLGWRNDMERVFAAADMLVLPTVFEQGSRASHEAAASGLPLIATAVPGAEALLSAGGGIEVARSSASVGAALERLAGDAGLRRAMGEAARRRVTELNRGADHARDLLALYERLA